MKKKLLKSPLYQGLTLPELIIVILVIAVILTISLTFFRTIISTSNSRQSINELIGSYEIAKNVAIHSNRLVFFELNLEANSYRAYYVKNTDAERSIHSEAVSEFTSGNSLEENEEDIVENFELIIGPTQLPENFQILHIAMPLGIQQKKSIRNHVSKIVLTPQEIYDDFLVHFGEDSTNITKTVIFQKHTRAPLILDGEYLYFLDNGSWTIRNAKTIEE